MPKEDLRVALRCCGDPGSERLRLLEELRGLKASAQVRRRDSELKARAGDAARRLGQKMDLGFMEAVQALSRRGTAATGSGLLSWISGHYRCITISPTEC